MRVVMICSLVLEGFSLVLVLPYYATKGMRKPPSQDLLGRGLSVYTSAGLTPSASSTASRSAGSTSSPWKDNHRSVSSPTASPCAASRAACAACRMPTAAWIPSAFTSARTSTKSTTTSQEGGDAAAGAGWEG